MRKSLLVFFFINLPLFAAQICGPTVSNLEYSYTVETPQNQVVGHWAVGTGCGNVETNDINNTLCTTIVATGYAACTEHDGFGKLVGDGWECRCTRLMVLLNGQLINSPSLDIVVWFSNRDTALCQATCSRICAEEVVTNSTGFRNAIMTLPE